MPFRTDRSPRASFALPFAALLLIGTLAAAPRVNRVVALGCARGEPSCRF